MGDVLQQGDALAFANPEKVMQQRVPYFFTSAGFNEFRLKKEFVGQAQEGELWVLGEAETTASVQRELSSLGTGLSAAYAGEYIKQWEGVIEALAPADYFNNDEAYRAFTKGVSPLKSVLEVVRQNTTFNDDERSKHKDLKHCVLE